MLTILVSGPKQPGDRIDVYLRPLVDDLKILWKRGVLEVWNEYKCEEFTMHGMLFTTINDNPAHHNLSIPSKSKGATCPHCLKDTCTIWLRHSKKYIFMGHRRFLGKNIHTGPWIVSLMGKRRIERRRCMWLEIWSTWKSRTSKLSRSYPNWLKKPLAKERNEMVNKKKECGTRNQFYGS
jgi:hypothetical protein